MHDHLVNFCHTKITWTNLTQVCHEFYLRTHITSCLARLPHGLFYPVTSESVKYHRFRSRAKGFLFPAELIENKNENESRTNI